MISQCLLLHLFSCYYHICLSSPDCIIILTVMSGFCAMVGAPVKEITSPKYNRKVPIMGVFQPLHSRVYQSMDEPLSHYFIDSSHNTLVHGLL